MKQLKQQDKTRSRRRWIIIGPGIILALIFGLQIAIQNHKASSAPPIIERQVLGTKAEQGPIMAPELDYILERKDQLALSPSQEKTLMKLKSEWEAKSEPLMDQLNKASEDFQKFMKQSGGKATMRDIQSHAGAISELSRQVSSLRRVYWEKGMQMLDEKQRRMIEK